MKNIFLTTALTLFAASAAFAEGNTAPAAGAVIGGSINVEVTENAAGDYVATTTLGVGIATSGVAFGSATVESVDGATFEIDEWQVGAHVGAGTVSFGKQGDLMVENDFEIVGGTTIADLADDHESLQVSMGSAAVMIGLTDVTADVSDVENIQGLYTFSAGQVALTTAADYNIDSTEWTLGTKASVDFGNINLGGLATYSSDTELFGYEASAGYGIVTAFVNGDDADMLQNVGAGVATNLKGLDVYAEGSYNIDAKDTTVGAGVTFNF